MLTGISLGLETLGRRLTCEQSPHAQTVQNLKALTQKSISTTRRIALSLSPGFRSGLRIGGALDALAREVEEHAGVRCRAHCTNDRHHHHIDVATNLFRIAQESVTNALKHGIARNVELRYACDGGTIRLEVLDDGTGIPLASERVEGMGLRSMRYRAKLVNGSLEVERRRNGGTRVLCVCPCQA